MTDRDIKQSWERAERLARNIWEAYITGVGLEQAKKDQKSLTLWLDMVKNYGIVYNNCYDEYVTLKL